MIEVEASPTQSGWTATVDVMGGGGEVSRHTVRLTHADMERWGRGGTPEELVRRAFEFLLQRESPREILKSFDLADIQRYFPDFVEAMSR